MAVRLNITKKGKIIILICFMLVFAGAGGYLLWRVNQEDTVSPEDSEAGQSNNGACWACCSGLAPACPIPAARANDGWACSAGGVYCARSCTGITVKCGDGVSIKTNLGSGASDAAKASACTDCLHAAPDDDDPVGGVQCNAGSQCNEKKCYWPSVAYCKADGTCDCKSGSGNGCTDTAPTCTPVCNGGSTAECSARCGGCNNLYYYKIDCNTNTCDTGSWITKPTGTYKHCDAIEYSATATDSDGIKESSIKAKLNNTDKTTFTKNTSGITTTISDTLSNNTSCLAAGSYTLNLSWSDTKGATSTACTLATTFTVLAEETNPDWTLTKNVVEVCKDENTENPTSELTYTITLKNIGNGEGTITKIVDTLDTKVLATYISSVSNDGTYASGAITWTPTDTTFDPQEQRIYTYKVTVPKDTFGEYANTVTAYPAEGDNVIANAAITADCVIEAPDTGLFDSTWSKIVAGVILIAIGINYERIISSGTKLKLLAQKTKISMRDLQDEARKKNFEKKVVKK